MEELREQAGRIRRYAARRMRRVSRKVLFVTACFAAGFGVALGLNDFQLPSITVSVQLQQRDSLGARPTSPTRLEAPDYHYSPRRPTLAQADYPDSPPWQLPHYDGQIYQAPYIGPSVLHKLGEE